MFTAIFISSDRKFAGQCELWVRQGLGDRLRIESYSSIEAYKQMLEADNATPGPIAAVPPPGTDNPEKIIRVFVIEVELLGQKPVQTVLELQRLTKEKKPGLIPQGPPRVMVMAFEGGSYRLDQLQHDSIDDLILKPLDKSLFQQKLEFLIAEGNKVTPTFLFRAKTAQVIEVGRDVMIDEISEFAIAIRSPGPVPEGAFASIHCDVFGVKGARRIIGRVFDSGKHPVREGEYIVRFAFFGITTDQLSTVRRYIRSNQTQVRTAKVWGQANAAPGAKGTQDAAAGAGGKPSLSKELMEKMALLKTRKMAVIDMNIETMAEAKSILDGGFKGVVVRQYPSYTRLASDLSKLLSPEDLKAIVSPSPFPAKEGAKAANPVAIEQTFPNGKKLSVILRGKSHDLVRFEPDLRKSDIVMGKTVQEWLDKPDQWQGMVERDDREGFEEFLGFVESGAWGRANFRMSDATGRIVYFEAMGQLDKADGAQLVRVELNELDHEGYMKSLGASYGAAGAPPKDPAYYKCDAILIDAAMLRPTPAVWYENFITLMRKAKVLGPDEAPPKVIVMADPRARLSMEDFRIKGISAFCSKPLDRRYIVQLLASLCPQMVLMREPEAPPFVPCELHAKLGKEVTMDEVSEYGLSILHPTAFREKSHMRFFSRLFGDEGEWVAGRCWTCEKSGEGENYRCHFLYFGPSEDLLQRIRRWIREDYVSKKEKSGGA